MILHTAFGSFSIPDTGRLNMSSLYDQVLMKCSKCGYLYTVLEKSLLIRTNLPCSVSNCTGTLILYNSVTNTEEILAPYKCSDCGTIEQFLDVGWNNAGWCKRFGCLGVMKRLKIGD